MVTAREPGYLFCMESNEAAEHRDRAAKMRRDAVLARDEATRRSLSGMADAYDKLAIWADLDSYLVCASPLAGQPALEANAIEATKPPSAE